MAKAEAVTQMDDPLEKAKALEARARAAAAGKRRATEDQRRRNREMYPEFTAMVDAVRDYFGEIRITDFKPMGGNDD